MGELKTQRPSTRRWLRPHSTAPSREEPTGPFEPILQLQRQAGNHAVAQLLRPANAARAQRAPTPENPPVSTLNPTGTTNDQQWAAAYKAAVAQPSVAAYEALFRDIAITAGMDQIPGFNLASIPSTDGKTAQPGLNFTLKAGESGHTAWVDKAGKFGVKLAPTKKQVPEVAIAVILGPVALSADKGLSLRTIRHEMVHARHKVKVLEAIRTWQAAPGQAGLDDWLKQQVAKKKMSDLDLALISKGAQDAASNTEVLGYVEGFTNDFHRRAATMAAASISFFELLGVVVTEKVYPWAGADPAVRQEALARLNDYHGRLDPGHQRLWKEWLDRERGKVVKAQPGRTDFLDALSAFVV
ncbi:hypothetical protein ACPPVT_12675 [Angustibacter sp. McL0619]|uniref:hypothetical protein n=1 Tax=Angustibacter sp. McL0619 TaxID=3415676 RepID=UPI003CFA62CE